MPSAITELYYEMIVERYKAAFLLFSGFCMNDMRIDHFDVD